MNALIIRSPSPILSNSYVTRGRRSIRYVPYATRSNLNDHREVDRRDSRSIETFIEEIVLLSDSENSNDSSTIDLSSSSTFSRTTAKPVARCAPYNVRPPIVRVVEEDNVVGRRRQAATTVDRDHGDGVVRERDVAIPRGDDVVQLFDDEFGNIDSETGEDIVYEGEEAVEASQATRREATIRRTNAAVIIAEDSNFESNDATSELYDPVNDDDDQSTVVGFMDDDDAANDGYNGEPDATNDEMHRDATDDDDDNGGNDGDSDDDDNDNDDNDGNDDNDDDNNDDDNNDNDGNNDGNNDDDDNDNDNVPCLVRDVGRRLLEYAEWNYEISEFKRDVLSTSLMLLRTIKEYCVDLACDCRNCRITFANSSSHSLDGACWCLSLTPESCNNNFYIQAYLKLHRQHPSVASKAARLDFVATLTRLLYDELVDRCARTCRSCANAPCFANFPHLRYVLAKHL